MTPSFNFLLGALVGMFIVASVSIVATGIRATLQWQRETIKRGVARYHPDTGNFRMDRACRAKGIKT